ncbi:MAG: hypothetical protein ACP5MH_10685, partial [Thermoproteus sp.]
TQPTSRRGFPQPLQGGRIRLFVGAGTASSRRISTGRSAPQASRQEYAAKRSAKKCFGPSRGALPREAPGSA